MKCLLCQLTEQQQSERKRFLEDYERRLQQFKEDEAKVNNHDVCVCVCVHV